MSKVFMDKYTKEQAMEYANNEAESRGFKAGSDKWKDAFKEYLSFAFSTMSVGRNPRGDHKYKVMIELYPEIFGDRGFAGKVAPNYLTQEGRRGVPLEVVQDRILSSVNNLMKLFENAALGVKNTTTGNKPGEIPNSDMSELQFPKRESGMSDEEYSLIADAVVRHWLVRDIITNSILESLAPFFRLSSADINDIMSGIKSRGVSVEDAMGEGREDLVKTLRAQVKPKVDQINYKKLVKG